MFHRITIGLCLMIGLWSFSTQASAVLSVNLIRPDWVCKGEAEYFDQQYIGKYTSAPDGNPWNKQFLSDMSIYHCIRFMDWLQTITVTDVSWATRTQKNGPNQKLIAFEWMCDLCNRTNCDMWLNVPHMADSTYIASLGKLIYANLNPGLKVYLEYSNETWWEGNCYNYITGIGSSMGNSLQYINGVYGNSDWVGYTFLASRMWNWFRMGWKSAGGDTSLCVNLLAGQNSYGHAQDARFMLEALTNTTINPSKQKCSAFALAPYFDAGLPLQTIGALDTALQWLTPKGVKLVCYEGGHDDNSEAASQYDFYMTYLNALNTRLDGPFCQFGHIGTGCSVQWGAKSTTTESNTTANIYRALSDWSAAHPVSRPSTVLRGSFRSLAPGMRSASSVRSLTNVKLYRPNGSNIAVKSAQRSRGCYIAISQEAKPCMILNMGK